MRRWSSGLICLAASALVQPVVADPRADFLLHCGGCHLPDGSGAPPEVPTLRGELGWIAMSRDGRDYLVRVPGASQSPLSDEDLAAVVNWILFEFNADTIGDDFRPLSAREVNRARKRVLMDPRKYREALWRDYYGDSAEDGAGD